MTNDDRVPGERLRRFAERTFNPATVETVILPALADLQHECSASPRARHERWLRATRAYWGLWKTIGLCLIGDAFRDRDGLTASLSGRMLVFLPIVVTVFMLPNIAWLVTFASKNGVLTALTAGMFMVPATIVVALPVAFFLAVAMFRARADMPSTRLLPGAVAASLVCAALVLAGMMFLVPTTNQWFRIHVFETFQPAASDGPRIGLRKGLPEMTWPELNEHIRHPASSRQEELARAHRQQRFAFVASVFVLGLLGLGLAGRWPSRTATFGAALAGLVLFGLCFGLGAGLNRGGYPSTYGTWTANGAFFVIGLRLLRSNTERAARLRG